MGPSKTHYRNMGPPSSPRLFGAVTTAIVLFLIFFTCAPAAAIDAFAVVSRVEAAYKNVTDYQTQVEVKSFKSNGSVKVERFLYRFRKPKRIRLDMETPHAGMVLIYPDENGKVLVRLSPATIFPALHLALDNRLLRNSAGQRLDQTDLGALIEKMSRSLTDQERGPAKVIEEQGMVSIRVLAEDHFLPGVTTLYGFSIDERLWLPVLVEEATPEGNPKRTVTFRDLRTNTGITRALFQDGHG